MPKMPGAASPSTTAKYGITASVPGEAVRTTPACLPSPGPSPRAEHVRGGSGGESAEGASPQDAIPRAVHRASPLGLSTAVRPQLISRRVVIPQTLQPAGPRAVRMGHLAHLISGSSAHSHPGPQQQPVFPAQGEAQSLGNDTHPPASGPGS